MKKIKIILWLLIGGVILMTATTLTGCSLGGETIPKNRTKEQYEFEKTFEPMFKFLEQEKKDFTGIEAYQSSVYIKIEDDVRNYEVDLDTTKADIKGKYKIISGGNKEIVPVTYSNGTLHYESDTDPLFDEGILNLAVSRDYFTSLDVENTFKSAETELSEIIYQPENHSKLYKYLKNKYDLPEDTNCRVRIKHSSGGIYRTSIQIKSMTKSIQIDLRIFEN
jgi:putative lipoprotein